MDLWTRIRRIVSRATPARAESTERSSSAVDVSPEEAIGRWAYLWSSASTSTILHPDDRGREAAIDRSWRQRLLRCEGATSEWLTLAAGEEHVRVARAAVRIVPPPRYSPGDAVRIASKPDRVRRVLELRWHRERQEVVYHIEVDDDRGTVTYFFEAQLTDD